MKTIPLFGSRAAGRVALVDDEDYRLVSAYRWTLLEQERRGGRTLGPYAWCWMQRDGRKIRPLMHTMITGWPRTDHIDHDGLNNRRSNLRSATRAQNNHNQRPALGHSSKYKGVTWHRGVRKWQVSITPPGDKRRYLGIFTSEEDAARVYDEAALRAFGEYAYLNFGATR